MMRMIPSLLVGVVVIVLVMPKSAWAYLDPGAGSMILQMVLGGVAGVLLILKLYWRRWVSWFRREDREETKNLFHDNRKT